MPSTYVNNLRLTEMATGEETNNWGNVTNTNLELVGEALGYGTENLASDANATITIADGAADAARSLYLRITSTTLTATRTITLAPNTVSKVWMIENATTGGQSITIKQGTGATVTIANGKTVVVYTDGAGAGAKVVDANATLQVGTLDVTGDVTFHGDTAGRDVTWDASDDALEFADLAKLKFGTDGDMELYHDSGNSIIADSGTGVLALRSNGTGVYIQKSDGTSLADFVNDGAVNLYHNGVKKLESNSSGVNVSANEIKVGDNAAAGGSYDSVLHLLGDASSGFKIGVDSGNTLLTIDRELSGWQNNQLVMKRDTGNVGINVAAPGERLAVGGNITATGNITSTGNQIKVGDNNAGGGSYDSVLWLLGDSSSGFRLSTNAANTAFNLEREMGGWQGGLTMTRSNGYVGLGTSAPSEKLHVVDGGGSDAEMILETTTNSTGARIHLKSPNAAGANYHTIGSMNASTANWRIGSTGTAGAIDFQVGSSYSQIMRINSTGVSIGTTTPDSNHKLEVSGTGTTEVGIRGGNSSEAILNFGDTADRLRGRIAYNATNEYLSFWANAGEKVRIGSAGQIGIGGANYGTDGQVLTSQGASSPPQWEDAGGGGGGATYDVIYAGTSPSTSTYIDCNGYAYIKCIGFNISYGANAGVGVYTNTSGGTASTSQGYWYRISPNTNSLTYGSYSPNTGTGYFGHNSMQDYVLTTAEVFGLGTSSQVFHNASWVKSSGTLIGHWTAKASSSSLRYVKPLMSFATFYVIGVK